MGVPKFFRWISERYPCLSELVKEHQIPSFDNLYLDMNGIIHMCSHPNDHDPHFRISEEKICKDIFHYIEILFQMIKPQKLFFMAVDGVAPRAKQNQQRGRRFRTAKDAEVIEKRAKDKGEALPDTARFDSNCITPGTVFMTRLQEELKYYVARKISTDSDWQRCKIILSGHETPGEGEHKIMDYIRYMKSRPDYDPNTRHCLYGLDADLIMLGLCSHEPHFALLREEVKFGKGGHDKRISTPEETTFYLLHLSLMREYLEIEFRTVKKDLPFPFDLESIIDDWVLMGFLVGNDFIPPLPDMHISEGALPLLYQVYMKVLPTLNGYINEKGTLNLPRFQKYMEKLAQFDLDQFQENYADLMYFQAKTGRSPSNGKIQRNNRINSRETRNNKDLDLLIQSTNDMYLVSSEDEEEFMTDDESVGDCVNDMLMLKEFRQHKNDYYMNKLEYTEVTPEVMREQAECYVRAIQWNLHYYYNGVCSWSWFYPHHYAPFASDIKDFADLKLEYEMGTPFLPFQQLLAVLPSASKELLPEAFQQLMVSEDSPIIDYYPLEFSTDLNGKKQDWEALVLIPFIDEAVLLSAMAQCYDKLTPEEKQRNRHGPMCIFTHTKEDMGGYPKTLYNPGFTPNYAKLQLVNRDVIFVEQSKLVKGLCPNIDMETYLPGFPTFRHIPYSCEYRMKQVKVFESLSRGDNAIVCITRHDAPDIVELANKILGRNIHVNWPHLVEARVVSISNGEICYTLEKGSNDSEVPTPHALTPADKRTWSQEVKSIAELYVKRRGVDVGSSSMLVAARLTIGRRYIFSPDGQVELVKQWAEVPSYFVLQAIVIDLPVYDQTVVKFSSLSEVFPVGTKCFLICTTIGVDNRTLYGQMGEVLEGGKPERVKVRFPDCIEPDLTEAKKMFYSFSAQFMPASQAAAMLGISAHLLSRITGNIFVTPDLDPVTENDTPRRVNIALHLKFSSKNEQISGYTKRDPNGSSWLYSMKTVELVGKYIETFSDVVEYLSNHPSDDETLQSRLFPQLPQRLHDVVAWLKEQEYTKLSPQACGSDVVDEEVVKVIENIVQENLKNQPRKFVKMSARPNLLYTPDLCDGIEPADSSATFRLFDRVINCRKSCSVPLGLKGVIIGIYKTSKDSVTKYDVVFDHPFPGALTLNCSDQRGYRVPGYYLINISHGVRLDQGDDKAQLLYMPALPSLKPVPNQRPMVPNAAVFDELGASGPPPVHEISKTPGRKITKEIQPTWRVKQTFQSESIAQRSLQNKEESFTILSRTQGVSAAAGTVTNGVPPNMMTSVTDFEALWLDLEKKQAAPLPEDGSSALRQLLRISGNGGNEQDVKTSQIQAILSNDVKQPAILQQMFQQWPGHSAVPTNIVLSESKSVCGQLLSLFQARNLGTPRYNYVENQSTKTFQATVKLPDGRSFTGQPCSTKEKASETAACEALQVLCKEPMAVPPIPPAQWCASPLVNQVQNTHVHNMPIKYPALTQQSPAAKNDSKQNQNSVTVVPFLPHFAQSPQRPSQSLQPVQAQPAQQRTLQTSYIPPFLQSQGSSPQVVQGSQQIPSQAPQEFQILQQTQPPQFVQSAQATPVPVPHIPPFRQSPQQTLHPVGNNSPPSQQSAQFAQAMQQVTTQVPPLPQQFAQLPQASQFPHTMPQGRQNTPVQKPFGQQQTAGQVPFLQTNRQPLGQPQAVIQPPSKQAQYSLNQNTVIQQQPSVQLGFRTQAQNIPTTLSGSILFPHNQLGRHQQVQQQQYRQQNAAAFMTYPPQMQHMQQIFPPRGGVAQPNLFPGAQQAFPVQTLHTKPFPQQNVRLQSVPAQQSQTNGSWRSEVSQSQMPFVPLQAVKQQRKEATPMKQSPPKSKQQSEVLQPTLPVFKQATVPNPEKVLDATAPSCVKPVSRKICANFSGMKKKKKEKKDDDDGQEGSAS